MADTQTSTLLAARDHPVVRGVAAWLAESGVSRNAVALAGPGFALVAGGAFAATWWVPPRVAAGFWLIGAIFILLRLAANVLGGAPLLARGGDSALNDLQDEIADRIADTAVLVGVGLAAGGNWGLGLGAALAAMATAHVRTMGKAAGAPSEFLGPMAKQQRMFLVAVVALWSALAPTEWQPGMGGVALPALVLIVVIIGALVTALKRFGRIACALAGAERTLREEE